ncbi:diguanylate cyclase [compost metagenome]
MSGLDDDASTLHFEQLRQAVQALRLQFGGKTLAMTVSIGVCRMPSRAGNLHQLITEADRQLYLAKAAGRNRVCSAEKV